MTRHYVSGFVWALVLGAASVLAAFAVWAAAFPLAVLLVTAVVLWVGNLLADRLDTTELQDARRYTGRRN